MRNAETILGIIRDRGTRELPLENVYRLLYNPALYLRAYNRIYRNKGAMTPGVTDETADAMSLTKIASIIDALRAERYRWKPVRRIYIDKRRSKKKRPLGLPPWSDKLLQEVIRSILEADYEPQFSDHSHGFREGRGCHSALNTIYKTWIGTTWFIEGDIAQCYDSLDHSLLLSILGEKIHDNRFLRLIDNLLKAGYLEQWRFTATLYFVRRRIVEEIDLDHFLINPLHITRWQGNRNRNGRRRHHILGVALGKGVHAVGKTCSVGEFKTEVRSWGS
jgi:retron-type reverse transcriptase